MKRFIFAILLSVMTVSTGFAQDPAPSESAETLLKSKINAVLDVLEKQDLSDAEKRQQIEQIVDPVFNYELMAKLSMGRENWARLNEAQRREFIDLFVKRLKASYFDKMVLYQGDSDAQVRYLPVRHAGDKVHIPVEVRAKGSTIEMVYKMYPSNSGWQVYDAEINGVSIVQSYRSQFNQVLARGTVEDLLQQLRKPVEPQQNS